MPGISCVRPLAPAGLSALGLKLDSWRMSALSSAGSTPWRAAAASISAAKGVAAPEAAPATGAGAAVCAAALSAASNPAGAGPAFSAAIIERISSTRATAGAATLMRPHRPGRAAGRKPWADAPDVGRERDLVEQSALAARLLGLVLGGTALLQTVEGLPATAGLGERAAALGDGGLAVGHLALGVAARLLDAIEVGLHRNEGPAVGRVGAVATRGVRLVDLRRGGSQQRSTAHALREAGGEGFLRAVLVVGAKLAHAFEAEPESGAGGHGRVFGRGGTRFIEHGRLSDPEVQRRDRADAASRATERARGGSSTTGASSAASRERS